MIVDYVDRKSNSPPFVFHVIVFTMRAMAELRIIDLRERMCCIKIRIQCLLCVLIAYFRAAGKV